MTRNDMMSVAELEQMLEQRRSEVNALVERREELTAELAECDAKIAELNGGAVSAGKRRRVAKRVKPRRVGRKRGQPSLKSIVTELLEKNRKGLTLDELVSKVEATGYKSSSTNFKTVVYQTLYAARDQFKYDSETKLYKMTA